MSAGRKGTYKLSDDNGMGYIYVEDDADLKEYDDVHVFTPADLKAFAEEIWTEARFRDADNFADYWKERE
jgi:hypothetical protein